MKPTIDMTRRKSPLTLDAVLRNQRRRLQGGDRDCRLKLRPDQLEEFYALLAWQVQPPGENLRLRPEFEWNSLEVFAA